MKAQAKARQSLSRPASMLTASVRAGNRSRLRYTSGDESRFFGWRDAENDDARSLADKFVTRFARLAGMGSTLMQVGTSGFWAWPSAAGCRSSSQTALASSLKRINLQDLRPAEWRSERDAKPSLPLPPAGKLRDELR
jgi:hypothetical protein